MCQKKPEMYKREKKAEEDEQDIIQRTLLANFKWTA